MLRQAIVAAIVCTAWFVLGLYIGQQTERHKLNQQHCEEKPSHLYVKTEKGYQCIEVVSR